MEHENLPSTLSLMFYYIISKDFSSIKHFSSYNRFDKTLGLNRFATWHMVTFFVKCVFKCFDE